MGETIWKGLVEEGALVKGADGLAEGRIGCIEAQADAIRSLDKLRKAIHGG